MKKATHHTPTDQKASKQTSNNLLKKLIFPVIIIIIAIVGFILTRGKTTTKGSYPDDVRTESLWCTIDNQRYEPIIELSPISRTTRVDMIFDGTSTIQSIAIKHTMVFASNEETEKAYHHAGVTIVESLHDYGFSFNEFSNKVAVVDNELTAELYAKKSDLNNKSAYFFQIKPFSSSSDLPITLQEYRENYTKQGFNCKSTIDK